MKPMRVTAEVLEKAGCVKRYVKAFGEKWPRGLALRLSNAPRMEKAGITPCEFVSALTLTGQSMWGHMMPSKGGDTWYQGVRDFLTCVRKGHLRARFRRMMEKAAVEYGRKGKGGKR
jgi:hypothetical protein